MLSLDEPPFIHFSQVYLKARKHPVHQWLPRRHLAQWAQKEKKRKKKQKKKQSKPCYCHTGTVLNLTSRATFHVTSRVTFTVTSRATFHITSRATSQFWDGTHKSVLNIDTACTEGCGGGGGGDTASYFVYLQTV